MPTLHDAMFSTAAVAQAMGDDAHLAALVAFERALARAQGRAGVIDPAQAAAIDAALTDFAPPQNEDRANLFEDARKAGTIVVPFVKRLVEAVAATDGAASGFVHYGATSQDAIDTAHVLQIGAALATILADARRLAAAAAGLAGTYRRAIMPGRTLLQPATPITFGLKAAQWLAGVVDAADRVEAAGREALVLQFGGAAGTLGSLGGAGVRVADVLAQELMLPCPPLPWHTRRGALAAFGAALGVLCGHAGKIARDVSLMMQFELAEAFEPAGAGRGGSSAMPHKRNPVHCMVTLANAHRAPGLVATLLTGLVEEHERALGGWQAEWAVWPQLLGCAGGAVSAMADALEGLVVEPARLRANLDALRGLPMTERAALALTPALGRSAAQSVVEAAAKAIVASGGTLRDALDADHNVVSAIGKSGVEAALDPDESLGGADVFIDAALALHAERATKRTRTSA